jgi:hypothetical protein
MEAVFCQQAKSAESETMARICAAAIGPPPLLLDISAAICYPFAKQTVSEDTVISQRYETDLFFMKSLYE